VPCDGAPTRGPNGACTAADGPGGELGVSETDPSGEIKGARWALYRRPAELTERQAAKLSRLVTLNAPFNPAYLLKEQGCEL
jgi:hypothetical protein